MKITDEVAATLAENQVSCLTCLFFGGYVNTTKTHGFCRRYPPQHNGPDGSSTSFHTFPVLSSPSTNWCGEWQEKTAKGRLALKVAF